MSVSYISALCYFPNPRAPCRVDVVWCGVVWCGVVSLTQNGSSRCDSRLQRALLYFIRAFKTAFVSDGTVSASPLTPLEPSDKAPASSSHMHSNPLYAFERFMVTSGSGAQVRRFAGSLPTDCVGTVTTAFGWLDLSSVAVCAVRVRSHWHG